MILLLASLVLAQADVATAVPAEPPAPVDAQQAAMNEIRDATRRLAEAAERLSPPPPPAPVDAPPVAPKVWSATATFGLTWVTGNVTSIAAVIGAGAQRKGEKTILSAKIWGGYGQRIGDVAAGENDEILLYNAGAAAQFDYRFNSNISAFLGAGIDTDHVKSVEVRGYGDLGVGVLWIDVKDGVEKAAYQKLLFKTDLSLRVQPEQRFQYYPTPTNIDDELLVGPRIAAQFRYGLSAGTYLQEDLEIVPDVIGPLRVLINSTTKLAVTVASMLSVNLGFAMRYDSAPAAGKKPLDTVLTLGLEANY